MVAAVIVAFLYWARGVVIPFALAVFLAFILGPVVNTLRRWRLGRIPSVLLVVSGAVLIAAGLGFLISWQVAALVQELPDHTARIRAKVNTVRAWIEPKPGGRFDALMKEIDIALQSPQSLDRPNSKPVQVVIESSRPAWLARIESFVGPATEFAAQAALSFLLVVFLLLGREDMRNRVIRLIGPDRLTTTTRAVDDAGARISRYLRIQLLINALFGTLLSLALLALQVKYALLWGFIAGLMRYVPYIGTWLGLIPPFVAAIAMYSGWFQPLAVLASYIILEVVTAGILEPRFFGKSLGLSEVAQVLSAAFWAFLWGPIGLILSGPLTACLVVLGKNVPQLHSLNVLLGDEEPLSRKVSFYQRLAARDRDEAALIAEEYLKEHSTEQTIDELFIPALASAQAAADRRELADDDLQSIVLSARRIADDVLDLPQEKSSTGGETQIKLLAVAANEKGDALALELFATQLSPEGWQTQLIDDNTLASELVTAVCKHNPAVVSIISLAPGGFPHVRYLSKRLRNACADVKLLVCRWGEGPVAANEKDALSQLGVDEVTPDLLTTLQLLKSWRSLLASREKKTENPSNAPESQKNGTLSAL